MKAQSKTNLIHVNFRRKKPLTAKGIYNKNYDKWKDIRRADDPNKKIAAECISYISAIEFLFLQNPDEVIFDSRLLKKKSDHKKKQRGRFLKQIADLYNIKFEPLYKYKGQEKRMVFCATRTENSLKILENPEKFYEENGLKNDPICSQKRPHMGSNLTPPYKDYLEKEEEPLAHSSSFSSLCCLSPENEFEDFAAPTWYEETPQEESTEIPTLATGYPTEPAKVYQTEEIRVEASEVVTNCDELEAQPYGKSVQLESQALTEEKELYQSHKNRESSSGISLLQDIPLLTNFLTTSHTEIREGTNCHPPYNAITDTETMQIQKEITEMKAQQIPIEPERNMEFELNGAIFKSFGGVKSDEIMENCKFIPINENKLGVQLSNGFSLTPTDRDRLKACIRLVYGEEINIVSSAVLKIAQPKLEILVKPQIQQYYRKWTQFRNDLLNYLPEKTGHHSLNAWFDKLRVSEDMAGNRIILTGSRFYVDSVYNRFQSAIEHVVTKNKVTLELHFENNDEKPIIYKSNGGF